MSEPVIAIEHVSRTFGQGASAVHAVSDVSVSIQAKSFVAIVGASGSGKSTLLNLMGGLDTPSEGRIRLNGVYLDELSDDARTRLRRDHIGFVFQFFNLLPTLTALENVALPAKLAGRSRRATRDRAAELLARVGLEKRQEHRPNALSGGEMQRVAIARALMMDPPVLFADEPTGNLDSKTGKDILVLLKGAVEGARTVVLVTHDPAVAGKGDRILTMADGQLVADEVQMHSAPPAAAEG